jgi:hypothetical protein
MRVVLKKLFLIDILVYGPYMEQSIETLGGNYETQMMNLDHKKLTQHQWKKKEPITEKELIRIPIPYPLFIAKCSDKVSVQHRKSLMKSCYS